MPEVTNPAEKDSGARSTGTEADDRHQYSTDLAPHHARLLSESAIAPEVAAARGYRTVAIKAELRRLGFAHSQLLTPTLLIPSYDVYGQTGYYQHRPDQPRINERGRPIKYESP